MVIRLPQPKKKPAHPYQRQPIHPKIQRWEKKEMILKGFPTTSNREKTVSWLIKSITDKTILFQKSKPSPLQKANTNRNALQCGCDWSTGLSQRQPQLNLTASAHSRIILIWCMCWKQMLPCRLQEREVNSHSSAKHTQIHPSRKSSEYGLS